MDTKLYEELKNNVLNKFIQARTVEEMKLQRFEEDIRKADSSIFKDKLEIPEDLSLRAWCPELYEPMPNPEVYAEQYKKLKEFTDTYHEIISEYYEGVIECMQKY